MTVYVKGTPIEIPSGPAGPDGNPIGTVINYMGMTAPKGYLVCDGGTYKIDDYPNLATFFDDQFGSINHFGGDGMNTFAVPDLRNLFLRGYHGSGTALSGNVGIKQEATTFPNVWVYGDSTETQINLYPRNKSNRPGNMDTTINEAGKSIGIVTVTNGGVPGTTAQYNQYTSRPVNAAVLYCIKAVGPKSSFWIDEYDTTDGWHVRKWSNGFVEMFTTYEMPVEVSDWEVWDDNATVSVNNFTTLSYPVPLSILFNEQVTLHISSKTSYRRAATLVYGKKGSNNETGQYGILRPGDLPTQKTQYAFDFYVTGLLGTNSASVATLEDHYPLVSGAFASTAQPMTSGASCDEAD